MVYLRIFEQALNNKLLVVELNNVKFIFSYDALIGFIYKNTFFIELYYKNYSNTTNKHISYIKNEYCVNSVFVETSLFEYIVQQNEFGYEEDKNQKQYTIVTKNIMNL